MRGKSIKKIAWLILLFCFISKSALAQRKVRIYGQITDEQGAPVELASIAVKGTLHGTTSDSNGNYELTTKPQDSLTLTFSCLGYQPVACVLPSLKDYAFSVVLKSVSQQIETVTVKKDRIEGVRMNTINAETSQVVPNAAGSGVEALITTLTGVSTRNEMSSQYSVRGGNFDENLVYVNGIEVYRPLLIRSGQQEGLSFINPALVENISFSTGGFDAQYGDKMSSVLDIRYRKPTAFAASASASLLGASAHLETISKDGKFTQLHGIRYKTASYLLKSLEEKGEYDPSFADYQTLLTYKFNPNWALSFLGNYTYNKYTFTPTTRETKFGTYDSPKMLTIYFDGMEDDLFRTVTGAATLHYTPHSSSTYSLSLSSFSTNERERYDILGEYWIDEVGSTQSPQDNSSNTTGSYMEHARNDLQVNVNTLKINGAHETGRHFFRWENALQIEGVKDDISEWLKKDSAGYSQPVTSDALKMHAYLHSKNDLTSFKLKGYLQDTYKADKWSLTYGLRYSYGSLNKELTFSPRAALVYAPRDNHFFRLAAGRYVQTPLYKEMRNRLGEVNMDIKSQKSLHFVFGYDYFFKMWQRPFKYTFEAYYKHLSDLIPYEMDNVRLQYYGENCSKGYAHGLETRIYGEFVPGVDSWLGISFMKTEEKLDASPIYVPRPTDQRFNFTLFFQDYLPGNVNYKSHLRMIFGSGLPFGPPKGDKSLMTFRSRPYQRVDWGLSRLITGNKMAESMLKSLWIDLEVLNLFGIKNTNSYFWLSDVNNAQYAVPNYLTGRRFNLKLTVTF